MEAKAQDQPPDSKWSVVKVLVLLAVAVLVCAAMVVYWILEDELPLVGRGFVLPLGIMAGLMAIAIALRSHYGMRSLLGSRFPLIAIAFYFLFFSITLHSGGSITLAIISYALGIFMGMLMGVLTQRIEERYIVGDRIRWAIDRTFKDIVLVMGVFSGAIIFFFALNTLFPGLNGVGVLAGCFLSMSLYSLGWTYLYEKRNGIRVISEGRRSY